MLAILPALALVQPYNLRGEDINVTIGPHPGGFPHHVENVTYDCRSEIELCRELFDAVEMGDRAEVALQAATDAEPGSVNTTALAAAIEQARAVEVPTEIINEAETVLKEAMKLQDRIVP